MQVVDNYFTFVAPLLGFELCLMGVLYLFAFRKQDAGVVDLGWTAGIGISGLYYAWRLDQLVLREVLVAGLAAVWAFRLAAYLFRHRIYGKHEDLRYQALRKAWGSKAEPRLFAIFLFQGLLAVLFSLPVLVAMQSPSPKLEWFTLVGVAWGILCIVGEMIADEQLTRFRNDQDNQGKVCTHGLWRYSRHPNYFFEWMFWFSFVWMGLSHPSGLLTLLGPALMYLFLMKITGIPHTERRSLQTRGEAYRQYQQTTNRFIPWFPRRAD